MNKIRTFFLTIFLGICFSLSAQVDVYQTDIVSLLNSNGTLQELDFEYEKTLTSLRVRVAADDTPQLFWDEFREGKKESIDELISIVAFAYRKNFTHSEIIELLDFYSTIAAKKLIDKKDDFTEDEIKIIEDFNASEIAQKVETRKNTLTTDVKDIVDGWRVELFSKGIGALAKAGHTK